MSRFINGLTSLFTWTPRMVVEKQLGQERRVNDALHILTQRQARRITELERIIEKLTTATSNHYYNILDLVNTVKTRTDAEPTKASNAPQTASKGFEQAYKEIPPIRQRSVWPE